MQHANHTTVVQKYGGACLETPAKVRAVASAIAGLHSRGHKVVVIVSAMGKTTDQLIELAYQVSPHPNRRELDMLLSTGERVSMALMSMALSDLGVPAISFTGSQAGVMTDDSHSQARIVDVRPVRVREELSRGKVVVLAGFQGVNPANKEITTLGRGGSDTTAVAMAAALKADRCEIIKEVDGVCSADPRLVPSAVSLNQLNFATLSEMCFWGAKVLHYRCVELAQSQNVPLVIRRWGATSESTTITNEVLPMESEKILSINSLARVEHLGLAASDLTSGYDKLAAHLKTHGLSWPQILASAFDQNECRLMFTADNEALDSLLRTVKDPGANGIRRLRDTFSAVTITCLGSVASGLAARALDALKARGIQPEKLLFSPQSLTFIVPPTQREAAIQILHKLIA